MDDLDEWEEGDHFCDGCTNLVWIHGSTKKCGNYILSIDAPCPEEYDDMERYIKSRYGEEDE